jgi:hypothetical protein
LGRPGQQGSLEAKRRWLKHNPRKTISITTALYQEIKELAEIHDISLMETVELTVKNYKV